MEDVIEAINAMLESEEWLYHGPDIGAQHSRDLLNAAGRIRAGDPVDITMLNTVKNTARIRLKQPRSGISVPFNVEATTLRSSDGTTTQELFA